MFQVHFQAGRRFHSYEEVNMLDNKFNLRRVVILTAIQVEYQAVRVHLADLHEEIHEIGTVYERGTFSANSQLWIVGIVEVGVGNTKAAVEVERAIGYFNPTLILFVGVAGGLKDVKLGDVVAATKVYAYESGKAKETFEARPDVGQSTYRLEQRARAEAKKTDWLKRIQGPKPAQPPRVFVGPIATGDRVLASREASDWKLLKSQYGDALAVEMEGHGFIHAAHAHQNVDALVIRGISDLIDGKDKADAANFQEIAARHASAFAFELLAKLEPGELRPGGRTIEAPVTGSGNNQLFQDFLASAPRHYTEIKKICDLFGQGQEIYPDQCERSIKALDNLDEPVQSLCRDTSALGYADSAALVNLHSQISELRSDLHTFRHLCPPSRMFMQQRRQYDNNHRLIRINFDSLKGNLEQFINRI
jgi:nucleoside phosphorylase